MVRIKGPFEAGKLSELRHGGMQSYLEILLTAPLQVIVVEQLLHPEA